MIPNCCLRSLRGHRANIKAVIWSGSRLITGSSDHTIRIWPTYRPEDVNNSTHAGVSTAPSPVVLEGHDGRVWDFAVSKAGSTLASASGDATLKVNSIRVRLWLDFTSFVDLGFGKWVA